MEGWLGGYGKSGKPTTEVTGGPEGAQYLCHSARNERIYLLCSLGKKFSRLVLSFGRGGVRGIVWPTVVGGLPRFIGIVEFHGLKEF